MEICVILMLIDLARRYQHLQTWQNSQFIVRMKLFLGRWEMSVEIGNCQLPSLTHLSVSHGKKLNTKNFGVLQILQMHATDFRSQQEDFLFVGGEFLQDICFDSCVFGAVCFSNHDTNTFQHSRKMTFKHCRSKLIMPTSARGWNDCWMICPRFKCYDNCALRVVHVQNHMDVVWHMQSTNTWGHRRCLTELKWFDSCRGFRLGTKQDLQ